MPKTCLLVIAVSILISCCESSVKSRKEPENINQNTPNKHEDSEIEVEVSGFQQQNIKEQLLKYGEENTETKVRIKTNFGNMDVLLYEDTPLHRANFIRLSKIGFYDSTIFYRVVKNFMIQGGVNEAEEGIEIIRKKIEAGSYRIPQEILPHRFHKKGALAMANNSSFQQDKEKKDYSSEPYNFYIIHGNKMNNYQLKKTEEEYQVNISETQKTVYKTQGGAPHLDGSYTVFGEIISGMSVLDKIASTPVDKYEWPEKDVYILSIEVLE